MYPFLQWHKEEYVLGLPLWNLHLFQVDDEGDMPWLFRAFLFSFFETILLAYVDTRYQQPTKGALA
jgi:hypothetical protein